MATQRARGLAAGLVLLASACTDGPLSPVHVPPAPPPPGVPATLQLDATPGVGSTGGRARITVRVLDVSRIPVKNVAVALESSAGTLTPASLSTDDDGRGSALLEAPAGSVTVTATIPTLPAASALVAMQPAGPPPGGLTLQMTATTVTVGTPTQLSVEMQGGSGIVRGVSWTFGDGSRHDGSSTTITHTYPQAATYQANVVVSDTEGRFASVSNVVTVLAPPAPTPTPPNPTPPNPTPSPTPPALFTRNGTGASVFDLPTYVTRVRITGDFGGFCENFIVHIAGRGVVNAILGTCGVGSGPHFEGTFATSGGQVEVLESTGVAWSFTEIR